MATNSNKRNKTKPKQNKKQLIRKKKDIFFHLKKLEKVKTALPQIDVNWILQVSQKCQVAENAGKLDLSNQIIANLFLVFLPSIFTD